MRSGLTLRRLVSAATVMAMMIAGLPVFGATRAPSLRCRTMAQAVHDCQRPSASLTCCCSEHDGSQGSGIPVERNSSMAPTAPSAGVGVAMTVPAFRVDRVASSPTQGYRNRDLPTLFATFLL